MSQDQSAQDKPRRGRGRPSLGKPVLVVMSESDIRLAKELGDGVIAEGVRRALRTAGASGLPGVQLPESGGG